MKRRPAFVAAVLMASAAARASAAQLSGDFGAHDPSRAIRCDGKYYFYCTGPNCPARVSTDLRHWTDAPPVLRGVPQWAHQLVPQAKKDDTWIWAPDVISVGGLYYLYYSFSTFGSKTSVIGLVTSPTLDAHSPRCRWTDRGLVVASNGDSNFNAIDPAPAFDAQGNLWLTYGSWNAGGIQLVPLDKKTGKPASKSYFLAGGQAAGPEAPYLHYRKPFYYLFENEGVCCQGVKSTYRIMMGRSRSITGPYLDKNGRDLARGGGSLFAGAHGNEVGPGHMGIVAKDGQDWFTYHYYDARQNGRPMLGLDLLAWTADGWPKAPFTTSQYALAEGVYVIVSKASGLALSVGGDSADGASLTQAVYAKGKSQQWRVTHAGDGLCRITSIGSGKVMDLWRCNGADGTKIDQYRWLDNPCQHWKIEKAAGGFRMVSLGGGGAVSVAGGAKTPGAAIQEFQFRGGDHQIWRFQRLGN
ncbi:hypothetical protein CCAX7_15970 [Capsulimonas corticalis]|uniref:Uncharacterized protein n=1 Tax=Capsulimonas corticalis TaxID=2219043 RepID=A0A402CZ65_9BACT|nr:family 43 glycosylhydrolase [Capsulimonas corticalis]BDI29546.1 hypothetical protein CCAX7_15970 [Capsulimonas corticalis]